MREKPPVTQREYHFPEHATLLSVTDLDGRIRHANTAFAQVSGYSRDELIGQPHNLIRHPDMPAEAFADLWRTLKAGEPWNALVKNRRANGDHYWVRASITPMRRDGRVTGYLSVRTRPTREEVTRAERLYQAMRQGQAQGRTLHKGVTVRRGAWGWLTIGRRMGLRSRIAGAMGLAAAVPLLLLAALGWPAAELWRGAAVVALAMLAVAAWLEWQLLRPIEAVLRQAMGVAAGQPMRTSAWPRTDQIGLLARAVDQSGLNLRALMADVTLQISGLRVAATEIAQGHEDLSGRTVAAAASLQQTAAAMEQLVCTVQQSAEIAREAAQLASQAREQAAAGGEVVGQVVGTIGDIDASSQQIGELLGTIDAIAFQTNLLALNAAVEAARAGPAGRGFAVVASEVRALARRSSDAARMIRRLVQDSRRRVEAGTRLVGNAGETMRVIVSEAARVDDLLALIHRSVAEQSAGLEQIATAVNQLDEATQHNASLVEESTASAQHVRQQADRLAEAVGVFEPAV